MTSETSDDEMQDYSQVCLCCGGRGGWWSGGIGVHREHCRRCKGDGWEPSALLRRVIRGESA